MYYYHCGPIDHNWENLPTLKDWIKMVAEKSESVSSRDYWYGESEPILDIGDKIKEVSTSLYYALRIAIHPHFDIGWEGDFSHEPRIFFLPNVEFFQFYKGFIWKQSNNGSVFIACEIELPSEWISNSYESKHIVLEDALEFFKKEELLHRKRIIEENEKWKKLSDTEKQKLRDNMNKKINEEPECTRCKCSNCIRRLDTKWELEYRRLRQQAGANEMENSAQ